MWNNHIFEVGGCYAQRYIPMYCHQVRACVCMCVGWGGWGGGFDRVDVLMIESRMR